MANDFQAQDSSFKQDDIIMVQIVAGEREEDLLMYKNAHADLEILIQSVLSSFAFTLENAALEEYQSETSYIPPETTRLVRT